MHIREQGWECPKCTRIWAPKINACMACNDRGTLDHIPVSPYIGSPTTRTWTGTIGDKPEHYITGALTGPPAKWTPSWNWTAEDPSFTHD
jgi:hypothetical protein